MIAEIALDGEYFDAAASLAVSAAINSSDALCYEAIGAYPQGEDHREATRILRRRGQDQAASHLARVLSIKSKAQYSANRCTRREAEDAVKRASRLYNLARESVFAGGAKT